MARPSRRLLKIILGWFFLVLGVVGLVLPILQGFLFIAIGLIILAQEQPWAHRLMVKLRHRYPHMAEKFDHAHAKAEGWMHKVLHRRRAPPERLPPPDQ